MKPSIEKILSSFVEQYGEDEWRHFVNAGETVEERLKRFDWLMAQHTHLRAQEVSDTLTMLMAHGDNARIMACMERMGL